MTLTTLPFDDLLDVAPHVGQRVATFAWQLVDGVTDQVLGDLRPILDAPPVISHDTSQAIKRTIQSIRFGVEDTAAINALTDRIRPYMVIGGVSWPLGRFMFTDDSEFVSTGGDTSNDVLVDEMFIVDQQIDRGFATLDTATGTVVDLISGLPLVTPFNIAASPYAAQGGWSAGTRRAQILDELAVQGDYFTAWMNNLGQFSMIRTFDPAVVVPQFDWDVGGKVLRDFPIRTSDVLSAPNRFVVISNSESAGDIPIVGTYDVPPSAPHSIANRGFVIPDVRDVQLADPTQANAAARNIGMRQTIFERFDITTAPDPRHDSYDTVHWLGVNWLELFWSITCVEGAPMRHIIRRSYQ
jgi:hypothetical protein